jgi:hypothetical protein
MLGALPRTASIRESRRRRTSPIESSRDKSPGGRRRLDRPPFTDQQVASSGSVRFGSPFRSWGGETGNSRGFFGSITGLREDKMRGPELFTPAEPAMGNFASPVGATLVLDAAEKWACLIRYCSNATFYSGHSANWRQSPTAALRQKLPLGPRRTIRSHAARCRSTESCRLDKSVHSSPATTPLQDQPRTRGLRPESLIYLPRSRFAKSSHMPDFFVHAITAPAAASERLSR